MLVYGGEAIASERRSSRGVAVGPGKAACAAEYRVAKSRFELIKLLLIDLTMAALVEIHPNFAPDGNLLTATFVALEHF